MHIYAHTYICIYEYMNIYLLFVALSAGDDLAVQAHGRHIDVRDNSLDLVHLHERILIELLTTDCKLKASRQGSKRRIYET